MNHKQTKKLWGILFILAILAIVVSLVLYALKQNINLFYTPTELQKSHLDDNQTIRVGGYVQDNSVKFSAKGNTVEFIITDRQHTLLVDYHGVLPTLFREGQGVVVTGQLTSSDHFNASQVLAKHDEKYMPASIARQIKKQEASHAT